MNDQLKTLFIGIFVLAAIALIIGALFFLHPRIGDGGTILKVRFANIEKVNIGTRVTFAGKPIGEVIAIHQIFDARSHATDHNGRIYFYQLDLAIDSHVLVYTSDEIMLTTSGLLGEKTISIVPRVPEDGKPAKLAAGSILYARSTDPVEETLRSVGRLASKMSLTIDEIASLLNANREDITAGIHDLAATAKSTKAITADFEVVMQNIATGKSTIGKLLSSSDIYLQMSSILDKANTTMNDINHYGILFHLNKGWQRQRMQRMNEMEKLATPREFRDYLEQEFDQINTSIGRISAAVDKVEDQQLPLENNQFQQAFKDLMDTINNFSATLQLYNNKLQDDKDTMTSQPQGAK